jgi:hypothetical protein
MGIPFDGASMSNVSTPIILSPVSPFEASAEVRSDAPEASIDGNERLAAALAYARDGFFVFPMFEPTLNPGGCSCRKKQTCANPGKHPRLSGGFKSASLDEAKIIAWWSKYPNANIGIATGRRSNLIVIDVDDRNGGGETLEALLDDTGEILLPTCT